MPGPWFLVMHAAPLLHSRCDDDSVSTVNLLFRKKFRRKIRLWGVSSGAQWRMKRVGFFFFLSSKNSFLWKYQEGTNAIKIEILQFVNTIRLFLIFDSVNMEMSSKNYDKSWLLTFWFVSLLILLLHLKISLSCLYSSTKPFKSLFGHNTFSRKFHINHFFFPFFLFFITLLKGKINTVDSKNRVELECTLRNFWKNFEQNITFPLTSNLDCYI